MGSPQQLPSLLELVWTLVESAQPSSSSADFAGGTSKGGPQSWLDDPAGAGLSSPGRTQSDGIVHSLHQHGLLSNSTTR